MCGSMVDMQSATAEIRRGKKRDKKKIEEPTGQNIMACHIRQGGHKIVKQQYLLHMFSQYGALQPTSG